MLVSTAVCALALWVPAPAKPRPWSPHTASLYENIERLKLDVGQLVHVHEEGTDPIGKLAEAAKLPHK